MKIREQYINPESVREFVRGMLSSEVHMKRIESLSNGTLGVMRSASLAVHTIGKGLAMAKGLTKRHAIKQVDRMLSNDKINVWDYFAYWVTHLVGPRTEIIVAMDWTDYDLDHQATIALHLVTNHGRATPLIWKTVQKESLKDHRNEYEDEVLGRLRETLPESVRKVTVLADRGFCDQKLFEYLSEDLKFGYVIRMRSNILVENEEGEIKDGEAWVPSNGRIRTIIDAKITAAKFKIPLFVGVKAKAMKESWCLACSDSNLAGQDVTKLYSKRWTIEPSFRDQKNIRFGMGLGDFHVSSVARRDRLLLISALAIVLLTLLGVASEATGLDRTLQANTVKIRVYSLLNQGLYWYEAIPTMKEEWLQKLMAAFQELLADQPVFVQALGNV